MYELPEVSRIVAAALAEDLGVDAEIFARVGLGDPSILARDVTSAAVLSPGAAFSGAIVAREPLVVAGLPVAQSVWQVLARAAGAVGDPAGELDTAAVEVFPLVAEGAHIAPGDRVAEVSGPARTVLAGERTALNFLMVLSGIATETARWVAAAGPDLAVCDTRKSYPGLRALSKYAVRVGGGTNHRHGLWDMVLVKDNHIAAAGSVADAVQSARDLAPSLLVEVEADSVGGARDAAEAEADIVLLDNMSGAELGEAVGAVRDVAEKRGRPILTEASGGVSYDRLGEVRAAGVDRVSTSALTFARPVDLALDVI